MSSPVLCCEGLVHIYKRPGMEVVALQGLDLAVEQGEAVAVVGSSGSGKTTLMSILAAIERPTAGLAIVAGHDLTRLTDAQSDAYRQTVVGYLWQQASLNLTPELPALENLQLPLLASGQKRRRRLERADELLDWLSIQHCRDRQPSQLSGGEQQRLAIGVAIANQPQVLLADEPTAELDGAMSRELMADLRAIQRETGMTVVLVTHDPLVAELADRVVHIRDGRTSSETRARLGELAVLDRAGRLQLPRDVIREGNLGQLVRVRVDGGRVIIEPVGEVDGPR
jgi:putative ABC transport system ATP-binding protein